MQRAILILVLIIIAWPVSDVIAQQKMQFTQYMFNGLVINPAYAGADEALSLTFIHRSQWAGIEGAPETQTLSAHTLFKRKQFGLGLTIVNDKIGIHKNLSILSNYAYHIQTGVKSAVSFGLQAGMNNQKSDYTSLLSTGSNDPKLYSPVLTETFFNFGAGIYFRSERFHAGVSVPEFIPKRLAVNDTIAISMSELTFFTFLKYRIKLSNNADLEPGALLKYFEGVPLSLDANLNVIWREVLTTGFSYRMKESLDFLIKAQITPQLQFGYSYDHPVGSVARLGNGSHEAMVQYLFRYSQRKLTSPR